VGYINLTLNPGFNLVANQLVASPNNKLDTVLPGVPAESQVQKFIGTGFNVDIYDGAAWLDNATGNPSATTVSPGEGFMFFNPGGAPITSTLVGEVRTGNGLTVPVVPGFNFLSSIVPQEISLTAANGFAQVSEMQYQTLKADGSGFDILINDGAGWLDNSTGNPADARPRVGQGFVIFNPDAVNHNWVRDFNPNTP
jgi:hypothetical protein